MMLITIQINETEKVKVVVQRIEELKKPTQISTYRIIGSDKTVRHKYSDGAAKLAIKVLTAITKVPKEKKSKQLPGQVSLFNDEA